MCVPALRSPRLVDPLEESVAPLMSLLTFLQGAALGPKAGTATANDDGAPVPGLPGSSSSLKELCCGESEMDHSAAESSVTLDCLLRPVRAAAMLLLGALLLEEACGLCVPVVGPWGGWCCGQAAGGMAVFDAKAWLTRLSGEVRSRRLASQGQLTLHQFTRICEGGSQ